MTDTLEYEYKLAYPNRFELSIRRKAADIARYKKMRHLDTPTWDYSSPEVWLREAENMMSGVGQMDCLARKAEARARKLIWC